ncbi:MAG TPA: TonB-dependent receptor plug domain-containing protein [Dyella sp.]|uniref:TonB-dependent receptor n=1 Tax=Dyella sp. TaxID=1869338 RepID=UPI002D78B1F5|nr:TonB-dependent receptor plug domain-containing protein [Dyella sp.]HET6553254.1 TonB-dependent receptor plug domain-containing protein [Dyella sp.]
MSNHRFVPTSRRQLIRRSALALAVTAGITMIAPAFAQSSTGSVFGSAPVGDTVLIQSDSGVTREVTVDANGRYSAASLPLGTYKVSLKKDGAVVDSRSNVTLIVGAGTQVSFASADEAKSLGSVTVMANALPAIDVSQVDSRTVITSEQMAKLPLQRSAEAVAQLAPGVNAGSSYFTSPTGQSLNSFGGSSIAENAYYINGFNTSDPLHNFGGLTLPYGAVDQEQVLTGGYGAAYGRSDGGVINQVGKRGTNDWHFGGQVLYQPSWAQSNPDNYYLTNGQLYRYRQDNNSQSTYTYDAYFGGALIKDKLFVFGAVEGVQQQNGVNVGTVGNGTVKNYSYSDPKWYGKVDWNITDNNILELTGASNKTEYTGNTYAYNYGAGPSKGSYGDYLGPDVATKNGADLWTAKYTGYITDSLTVDALYGKMTQTSYSNAGGGDASRIIDAQYQNPAYTGGTPIVGPQTSGSVANPDAHDKTTNYRLDLNYKIGSHSITAGIDNLNVASYDIGNIEPGPGYSWEYGQGDPNLPISTQVGAGVGAPGGDGYYVDKYIYTTGAAVVHVKQRAQFIEDQWQVNDRLLLTLGLRNDQFTNYNPDSVPYIRLGKPNWAPRIGASWDVFGDSSLKVYGNAGRYYLDEPTNVAIRGAAGSTYTRQYFTYTGIDPATGAPTGLTQIPQDVYPGVSANKEYGQAPDPKTVTSSNVKAEYQDEYIAGVDKAFEMFGEKWTAGAKGTYRVLRNDLDDVCDYLAFGEIGKAQGFDESAAQGSGCYIMNPGRTADINVPLASGGYGTMVVPWSDLGMPSLKRKYVALDTYLEHPFDGKWYGRIMYTWSHSFGNTEGSVRSDIGQEDVSQTEDWDNKWVMTYANGDQANDRRHQIKAYGYYQFTPEWLVGANLQVLSGTPVVCLGYFGSEQVDPYNYKASYHFCGPNGTPSAPGTSGRTPWTEILSFNAEYRPDWAQHKLAFSVQVYNLFDQQRATELYGTSESGVGTASSLYKMPLFYTTPRYVQFGVSYDF